MTLLICSRVCAFAQPVSQAVDVFALAIYSPLNHPDASLSLIYISIRFTLSCVVSGLLFQQRLQAINLHFIHRIPAELHCCLSAVALSLPICPAADCWPPLLFFTSLGTLTLPLIKRSFTNWPTLLVAVKVREACGSSFALQRWHLASAKNFCLFAGLLSFHSHLTAIIVPVFWMGLLIGF